jgi:hypothetical protein
LLGLNDQRETIRNEKRGYDFQRGAGVRTDVAMKQAANGAA